jgi:hypothetical protein
LRANREEEDEEEEEEEERETSHIKWGVVLFGTARGLYSVMVLYRMLATCGLTENVLCVNGAGRIHLFRDDHVTLGADLKGARESKGRRVEL